MAHIVSDTFAGYLFALATDVTTSTKWDIATCGVGDKFPNTYIEASSWKTTPNHREEKKAHRDDNTRNLTRDTASGMKSSFEFSTRGLVTLAQKKDIFAFFQKGMEAENVRLNNTDGTHQRRMALVYWNDELNLYLASFFYLADIEYTINTISDTSITYNALSFSLVEY